MHALTLPERLLAIDIVLGVAQLVRDLKSSDPHYVDHGYSFHEFTSAPEHGFSLLFRLGVSYGAKFEGYDLVVKGFTVKDAPEDCREPIYCKPFEDDAIREALLVLPDSAWPPLEEIIATFLDWACVYGFSTISETRLPFTPDAQYKAQMLAFEKFGLARRTGTQFQWADKIAPFMRAAGLWNEENEPRR